MVSVEADTYDGNLAGEGRHGLTSSSASADATSNFTSAGSFRLGLVKIQVGMASKGTGLDPFSISDGSHTYSFPCMSGSFGCQYNETVPFNLGETFAVDAAAFGDAERYKLYTTAGGFLSFSLEEANGAPVASILLPEPGTAATTLSAMLLAGAFLRLRCKAD